MDFEKFDTEGINYVGLIKLPRDYDSSFNPSSIQRQIELSVTNGRGYESFGEALAVASVESAIEGIIPSFRNALEAVPVNNANHYQMLLSEGTDLYDPGFTINPTFEAPSLAPERNEEQMTLVEKIKLGAKVEHGHWLAWERVRTNNPELWARAFKVG